ncbi:MAG: hypothetical protein WBG63_06340, partial [Phormidesmis sp.]
WSSFGQFGAEISLKVDDRRVRYVIMYEATSHYTSQIKCVTLICETQKNGTQFTGSALKADQLLGEWRGTASMICASGELVAAGTSQWRLSKELKLVCEEQFDNCAQTYSSQALCIQSDRQDTLTSERLISVEATEETEDKSQLSYQLMLLPKGAYVLLPQEIKKERAFRIEVGWLSGEGVRSRFIRHYDTRGVWIDSVLIEDKMASV